MSLEEYSFYNEDIFAEVRRVTNGSDVPFKPASFYTVDHGLLSHKFITGLYRSKFNAEPFKIGSGNETKRGLKFSKDVLDNLGKYYYDVPDEIIIIESPETQNQINNEDHRSSEYDGPTNSNSDSIQTATDATDATHNRKEEGVNEDSSSDQNPNNNENISLDFLDSSKYYNRPSNLTSLSGEKSASVKPPPITTSVACVACVAEVKDHDVTTAEDEAAAKLRNKVKEIGLPAIPCIFCSFSDPIEFDLVLHYLEFHKPELFKLPIGKGSMEYRAEYAVDLAKRKMVEAKQEDELGDGENQ